MNGLTLQDVGVVQSGRPRLANVSLHLPPGHLGVVVGPNGAGKSTLLRIIAGLLRPTNGTVHHDGLDLLSATPKARAAAVAWLPQHPRPEDGLTAREVVATARYRFGETAAQAHRAAEASLDHFQATPWADRPMTTLSGGEAQRVRLATLHAQEAAWWLLDEPANHLDPTVRLDLVRRVRARVREGGGTLLVTHDLSLLGHLGPAHLFAMAHGRLAHQGDLEDPDLPGILGPLFGLDLQRIPVDDGWRLVTRGVRT